METQRTFIIVKIYRYCRIVMKREKIIVAENLGILVIATILLLSTLAVVPVFGDDPPSSPSSINCEISSTSITFGEDVLVSGNISPVVADVTVTLTYTRPNATVITTSVVSQSDGSFQYTFTPDSIGSWSVKASWAGNPDYLGSSSFNVEFEVTDPSAGFSIELIAIIVAIIVIIAVLVAYWFLKK